MGFVQIIKLRSEHFDELEAAHDEWRAATEGERTVVREMLCQDRDEPGSYWMIVEFPDEAAAARNNDLEATGRIAAKLADLATSGPEFVNLDLLRVDEG